MLSTDGINLTMLSIPCVKSKLLHDDQSTKIIKKFADPDCFQKNCDAVYSNFLSRNVIVRHHYFTHYLEKYQQKYTQVLILGVGLDTKPDTLACLRDKDVYGCDLAVTDIKQIYQATGVKTKTKLVSCDLKNGMNQEFLQRLQEHGFSRDRPTLVLWEGGTFYLPKKSVLHDLKFLNQNLNLIGLLVDYMSSTVFNPPRHTKARKQLELVQQIGCPWQSFFTATEIEQFYQQLGFKEINVSEHGQIEEKVWGDVQLDYDIMYLSATFKF
ncbi:class I SAM-dependent methyltransferase [Fructilactobacillus cliffordii]|uniref:Class I SAM-dependent methyltransferase n=1 Tax=Fructilactobacillus cliffordii TaxID=2940299 RepID=A0A9Q8ZUH7_9LACO|nr:class I SAM-dependent methyltransferase [Fructilactobacillus cliffordii]USS86645.1 class I SAM-dependent methyltransferase [Fructilactobacillus cliffordii]USS89640.1 class I SAM-dependent methyltransferase [Fructilactobacillus cliffordii]